MREPEAKFRFLDGIKAKPVMSVTEMTENLHFRSQAMGFASFSSGNKPFTEKEEVGFNFKKTSQKLKNSRLIKAIICEVGAEMSPILVDPVQRQVKKQHL